ncbi:hypothetical protein [Corallococcus silvisoli]|uniref:hypothetical protein n=1 Tax=Corallococcus silvisoli TaxID=2697031 RepID=UPI0013768952|nr:hypothetical protein [Corallococcus silvisoli]NBD12976.1 hypothetical protein [Corallococcus silvisoli]
MSARKSSSLIHAMQSTGTHHFIERTYREGGAFQWARETLVNAIEAGATRVEYGIEWQAVARKGVYRRVIADDGKGMRHDELVRFFNTFGGGGKPIGGVTENFGVGSKTSLLPWNRYGMVVVSWVEGEPSMVWLMQDPDTCEYGLKYWHLSDEEEGGGSIETERPPFDDEEHGCDWRAVKPDWIKAHGTVIVLLGNSPTDDTVLGDPSRDESGVHGIPRYLNHRIWEIPCNTTVVVDVLQSDTKENWPRDAQEAQHHGLRPTLRRTVRGARHWIEYPRGHDGGSLADKGALTLEDGTRVDWFLWSGARPNIHGYAARYGYIAALYRNELYNYQTHHSVYRSLGVSASQVRQLLWIVFQPPEFDGEGRNGAFPTTDRNTLKLRGGPGANDDLPLSEWASEFADKMPEPIRKALAEARTGESRGIEDEAWRDRLIERFGARWKMSRLSARKDGPEKVTPVQQGAQLTLPGTPSGSRRPRSETVSARRSPRGPENLGSTPGASAARSARVGGGLPHCRAVKKEDMDRPGLLAVWQPRDPEYPNGVVLLNVEHPVLTQQIAHHQAQYPDHFAEDVATEVRNVYMEVAIAKIAHSEFFRSILPSPEVDGELRSPHALTLALLGLVSEDFVIHNRLSKKFGKARPVD